MLEPTLRVITLEQVSVPEGRKVITGPSSAIRVLSDTLGRRDRECFAVLHLDARHRLISMEIVSVGTLTASLVHPREVFKGAFLQNAAAIICAHNHPSDDPTMSLEDLALYERLRRAGELLGVRVLDFLVVTASGFRSKTDLAGAL